jgi:hypothetical protein
MRKIEIERAAAGTRAGASARARLTPGLRWAILSCALAAAVLWQTAAGLADSLFDSLRGSWSGSGQIRYDDGTAEGLRCNAYYTGEGAQLRLAIRCESPSNKVDIRGQLSVQGETLSGTWEERTFNAAGEAKGRVSDGKMSLSVIGGGFKGAMSVSIAGGKQSVNIYSEGIKMKSVSISLGKS